MQRASEDSPTPISHSAPAAQRAVLPVCPECGTTNSSGPRDDRNRRALSRRRSLLPALAAFVVLFGILYRASRDPWITTSDIYPASYESRLAVRESGTESLKHLFRENAPLLTESRPTNLYVGWSTGPRGLYITRHDGWPFTVRTVSIYQQSGIIDPDLTRAFDDFPSPLASPYPSIFHWLSSFNVTLRQYLDATPRPAPNTAASPSPPPAPVPPSSFRGANIDWNLLAPVIAITIAYLVATVSLWLARRHARKPLRTHTKVVLVASSFIAGTLLCGALYRLPRRVMPASYITGSSVSNWTPTPFSHRDLLAWREKPDGDALLIRELDPHLGPRPSPDATIALHLAPRGTAIGASKVYGWPVYWASISSTRIGGNLDAAPLFMASGKSAVTCITLTSPDADPSLAASSTSTATEATTPSPATIPTPSASTALPAPSRTPRWPTPGLTISPTSTGWVRIHFPAREGDFARTSIAFSAITVFAIVFLVACTYKLTWIVCYAVAALRTARWVRAGRCRHCGYDLTPSVSSQPSSSPRSLSHPLPLPSQSPSATSP